MTDTRIYLKEEAEKIGIFLSGDQLDQFRIYLEFLLETNEKMNLTAIREPAEVVRKHFIDCLSLLNACELTQGARIADVGTGAGFPGMVLKIVRPDLRMTLIDSLQKRLGFLDALCERVGLSADTVHLRAEDAGRNAAYREQFDYVTARAVAPLNVLCEYCLPLVKQGGCFVAMKSLKVSEELEEAKKAIGILGGKPGEIRTFSLYGDMSRTFVMIGKIRPTPNKYPRQSGKAAKNPL